MRRIGVEEPAAVGAEFLDDLLRGNRALRDHLLGAFERRRLGIGAEVLRHALPHQHERADDRNRQQDVENAAGHIDPEIADAFRRAAGKAADQRHRQHDPDCRRDEVLHGQPRHLGEVAHRRFGRIGLPVGIGDEADRGIERRVGRDPGLPLRVERQIVLHPLQPVEHEETDDLRQQHADAVGQPMLLLALVDAAERVNSPLDRAQKGNAPLM
jgi:hypothetical protein